MLQAYAAAGSLPLPFLCKDLASSEPRPPAMILLDSQADDVALACATCAVARYFGGEVEIVKELRALGLSAGQGCWPALRPWLLYGCPFRADDLSIEVEDPFAALTAELHEGAGTERGILLVGAYTGDVPSPRQEQRYTIEEVGAGCLFVSVPNRADGGGDGAAARHGELEGRDWLLSYSHGDGIWQTETPWEEIHDPGTCGHVKSLCYEANRVWPYCNACVPRGGGAAAEPEAADTHPLQFAAFYSQWAPKPPPMVLGPIQSHGVWCEHAFCRRCAA